MNVKSSNPSTASRKIARLLRAISQPARLRILLALGTGEACVCHLEAALSMRQAYISQHMMALRDAGIVRNRKQGRNVYYRLKNTGLLDLITLAGQLAGLSESQLDIQDKTGYLAGCSCPRCVPENEDSFIGIEAVKS